MARFDLEISGDEAAIERIEQLRDRASNLRPVFVAVAEIMERGVTKQFDTQGGYLGEPWQELAQSTIERKARELTITRGEILAASGDLEMSLKGGRGHIRSITKTGVRVGTKDYVARFHSKGRTGKAQMPRRQLVGLSKPDRVTIFRLIRRHFTV